MPWLKNCLAKFRCSTPSESSPTGHALIFRALIQVKFISKDKRGKVNRLAVTLIQETGPKILSFPKTDDSTGQGKARRIMGILEEWNVDNRVIVMGFDTTSSWNKKGGLYLSSRGSQTTTPLDGLSAPCFAVSY